MSGLANASLLDDVVYMPVNLFERLCRLALFRNSNDRQRFIALESHLGRKPCRSMSCQGEKPMSTILEFPAKSPPRECA